MGTIKSIIFASTLLTLIPLSSQANTFSCSQLLRNGKASANDSVSSHILNGGYESILNCATINRHKANNYCRYAVATAQLNSQYKYNPTPPAQNSLPWEIATQGIFETDNCIRNNIKKHDGKHECRFEAETVLLLEGSPDQCMH